MNWRFNVKQPRDLSVEQADELFRRLAVATIKINQINADHEKRIAELKNAAQKETGPLEREVKTLESELDSYIQAHPERFIKPRQHVTDYGKYGLRSAASLKILDEEQVRSAVRAAGIPALIVIERLDKKILEKALADGAEIPGCEFRREEIAGYTVFKSLIEN